MNCPYCQSCHHRKAGFGNRQGQKVQRHWCIECNRRFSHHGDIPVFGIRKPIELAKSKNYTALNITLAVLTILLFSLFSPST